MSYYRTKLAGWLSSAADRLIKRSEEERGSTRFVDLAPTDQADAEGVYSGALTEATDNPRVMNIALTGPYGSGKSSIIMSFLKKYDGPVLQISLAAFLPDAGATAGQVSRQEIERSILQQMLYGADANRLPLSRFKRIQSPGRWAALTSLFTLLGLVACWHLMQHHDDVASGRYFKPIALANWLNLLAFLVGGSFLWLVCHRIYVASFGISLKSVSLKDIEIAPKAATEESILNRHLDEIIYFFQSTKYDLVVIEDLDRFENPEIFVTLREINSLINANAGVTRTVRFLYALRDDIFVSTDRTKFFEFIIPVIPIINRSNSIDKVVEQGKRLSIDDRLDKQFVREVSRYLSDLRLIQNIFNEYMIYVANLEPEGETNLDATKLLAILIYKNVFPSDFEKLHRGKGDLAEVLRGHERYISATEARLTAEIARLEDFIDAGEKQLPQDLYELRSIFAMMLVEELPDGSTHVGVDQSNMVPVKTLAQSDKLGQLLASSHVFISSPWQNGYGRVSLSTLQTRLRTGRTLAQREEEVENRSVSFKDATAVAVAELRAELAGVRMMKFNEAIRQSSEDLDHLFEAFGDDADLARFLVLEGYLDDTYYQYTSLFHSGRLSPSDNKFLIHIRGFRNPNPAFQIDNPREVVDEMRAEDFGRNYVLNVKIVDCLLADPGSYETQTGRLLEFIRTNFAEAEKFLSEYYVRGHDVSKLISQLAASWPGFAAAALASSASLTHAARILSHMPVSQLKDLTERRPKLLAFVAQRLPDILALGIDLAPERLQSLDLEVADLPAIESHPGFVRALFDEGLYELSIRNLEFICRAVLGIADDGRSREQNYTLMLETSSAPLLAKIGAQFAEYLDNVLLRLPDNRNESVATIRHVLLRSDVEQDSVLRFLDRQRTLLPTLEGIPTDFHAALFRLAKIEPTWDNCLFFMDQETYEPDALTDFLNLPLTVEVLGRTTMPRGDKAFPLRQFIIGNDALSEGAYIAYLKMLPTRFHAFPENLGASKLKAMVDLDRIIFSAEALAQIVGDVALSAAFVTNNIDEFLVMESGSKVGDDLREQLLQADIGDEKRLQVLRQMDMSLLSSNAPRAALVGHLLARTGIAIEELDADAAIAVVLSSRPLEVQISLFNLLQERLDDDDVREVLQSLPNPMPDIQPGRATPKLANSEVNREFASWLEARGFISSWKRGRIFDDEIRLYMFRK
ncbi:hypothetical protein [Sphingomonas sp. BK069]|uniref:YobI family P-loop NTPase n=1 Tax=Sphingomonas sp. BK069 TaxID=2586979 RepID=UPI0017C4432F|nr:hypothetical protein [Sphingomonas sp. BK069]MBB3348365.1 hypothetical protein [Sphingomonas sp. BK069]